VAGEPPAGRDGGEQRAGCGLGGGVDIIEPWTG
jgi:hypothetical protein